MEFPEMRMIFLIRIDNKFRETGRHRSYMNFQKSRRYKQSITVMNGDFSDCIGDATGVECNGF